MNPSDDEPIPTINCGGTELDIYEIMHRYRNDGSCDYVIEAALRAKANPWQLFEPAQLRLLIFDMEQEGHGEHPMCCDARAALAAKK